MGRSGTVVALAALAQASRLGIIQLLVKAGPEGLNAGQIARRMEMAPNALSFHFDRLHSAGLVASRRRGRSIIYAARFDTIDGLISYLAENCCNAPATAQCRRSDPPLSLLHPVSRGAAPSPAHAVDTICICAVAYEVRRAARSLTRPSSVADTAQARKMKYPA